MEGGVHGLHLGPLETPADVETCVALMRASDPWQRLRITEDACRRTITHPQREAYAAWHGPALVGFVVLAFQGPLSGYVQLLGVAPAARGPNLFLCVSAFNEGARRFYARLGFQEVGCLTDFLVHGEDEWLLRKTRGPLMATPAAAASPASPAGPR